MKAILLALLSIDGIGKKMIQSMNTQFGREGFLDTDKILSFLENRAPKVFENITESILKEKVQAAEEEIDTRKKQGISVFSFLDSDYPKRFCSIPDAPILFWTLGNKDLLHENINAAVIGTRYPSSLGMKAAKRLSIRLSQMECTVVSGLALGCDTCAHEGALEAKGKTIAVLPGGVKNIVPKTNISLAKKILSSGGLLLSEYPPDYVPSRYQYVERDRLQSALSEGVFVVEAMRESGTMHTVSAALSQKRQLFCYEPSEKFRTLQNFEGNVSLLEKNKALPVKSLEDIQMAVEEMRKRR